MKIPAFAEQIVVKLLLANLGPYIQKGLTVAGAAGLAWLTTQLPGAEQYLTPEILTGLLWVILDVTATKLAAGPLKEYATQLQVLMKARGHNVKMDSYIGPVMVETIKDDLKK